MWKIGFSFINLQTEKKGYKCLFYDTNNYFIETEKSNKIIKYIKMKTVINILLIGAIALLSYFCVMSILTPIKFDEEKEAREKVIIAKLVDLRKAEVEFKEKNGDYTASLDTLVMFLKSNKKKTVLKEGSLTEKQLESGLTEKSAAAIVRKGNMKEIIAAGLQNFRRDTAYVNMIQALYEGKYTEDNIDQIKYVPYSDNVMFDVKVNKSYYNSSNIRIPLFEASTPYEVYLKDLNRQEMLNKIDMQEKLEKFPGLKVGSVDEPNNNSGNWE